MKITILLDFLVDDVGDIAVIFAAVHLQQAVQELNKLLSNAIAGVLPNIQQDLHRSQSGTGLPKAVEALYEDFLKEESVSRTGLLEPRGQCK